MGKSSALIEMSRAISVLTRAMASETVDSMNCFQTSMSSGSVYFVNVATEY